MNRRNLFTALATLPFVGSVTVKAAPKPYQYATCGSKEAAEHWGYLHCGLNARRFSGLKKWLDKLPVQQIDGLETAICKQTGKPYLVLNFGGVCRAGDEDFNEQLITQRMQRAIIAQIELLQPKRLEDITIYWRDRLELETEDHSEFIKYSDDGPDVDFITGRPCIKDHNLRRVNAYCRLTMATKET